MLLYEPVDPEVVRAGPLQHPLLLMAQALERRLHDLHVRNLELVLPPRQQRLVVEKRAGVAVEERRDKLRARAPGGGEQVLKGGVSPCF